MITTDFIETEIVERGCERRASGNSGGMRGDIKPRGIKIQTKFFTDVGGPSGKKQQSVHSHLLHNSLGVGNIHL